jgi:hypothetical protein
MGSENSPYYALHWLYLLEKKIAHRMDGNAVLQQ